MNSIPNREDREKAIEVATIWWGDAIIRPTFNCGDDSKDGATANLLGVIRSSEHNVTPEQIERYKTLLKESINAAWEKEGTKGFVVASDYGPDDTLLTPAHKVGIHESRFPWKTTMWIYKDIVKVRVGRRAEIKAIWGTRLARLRMRFWDYKDNDDPELCFLTDELGDLLDIAEAAQDVIKGYVNVEDLRAKLAVLEQVSGEAAK